MSLFPPCSALTRKPPCEKGDNRGYDCDCRRHNRNNHGRLGDISRAGRDTHGGARGGFKATEFQFLNPCLAFGDLFGRIAAAKLDGRPSAYDREMELHKLVLKGAQ